MTTPVPVRPVLQGGSMSPFFQTSYGRLVESPTGNGWWHSIPLPDGNRTNGANPDKDHQFKMWEALQIPADGGLSGRRVLDVGANDGFFTLAALMAGASHATAIDSGDWASFPANLRCVSEMWGVRPEVVTADFRTYDFQQEFDVIFFFGVLYHVEDVFGCMKRLRGLLADRGVVSLETQMSGVESDLPVFEYASDVSPTVARQKKAMLDRVGLSNYLFPNEPALRN